jgi:beta-N-acetylhexosaminidase
MGKRILIGLLLVILVVGGFAAGATVLFRSDYQDVAALPSADSEISQLPLDLAVPEEETPETQSPEAVPETDAPAVTQEDTSRARQIAAEMTLQEKICQLLFVTPEALTGYGQVTQSGDATRSALEEYPVGGVVYFASNLVTTEQTAEMLENIQEFARNRSGFGLFLGVDEEGGSVARLADSLGTAAFEDMAVYGAAGDTAKAYEIGTTLAGVLKSLGFNVDFAPVADVLTNDENTVVQSRSFGSDPALVSDMVAQEVRGFVEGGVLCAPKHFPGHGSTGGDTHDGYAATDRTLDQLEACDLLPFQAAMEAGAPMIMVGHMTLTAIDPDNPASLSQAVVTGLLRDQLGYDGIVITDALNMGAVANNYTSGEAAVRAIQAGCDMLLCVSDVQSAVDALLQAVADGTISESRIDESVVRILDAKIAYGIAA